MKLPLKKDDSKYSDWGWIRDAEGSMIAVASLPMGVDTEKHRREKTDPTQERVDTIIRAVNCHEDMVEALEAFLDVGNCKASRDMAIAALEKARKPNQ